MSSRGSKRPAPPSHRKMKRMVDDMMASRSCGTCTACCDAIGVEEIGKPESTPCKHLCATGCGIYPKRPNQCRDYACGWKTEWTPNEESWRPDNLGAIFDMHPEAMCGHRAIRCWQLRSARQILDDPKVRLAAYAIAVEMSLPVVARFEADLMNVSLHFIPGMIEKYDIRWKGPKVPTYVLTPEVIPDPHDFLIFRAEAKPEEFRQFLGNFRERALLYGLRDRRGRI